MEKNSIKFLTVTILAISLLFGCSGYDELKNELHELTDRISVLEQRCNSLNADIVSLQTVIDALEAKDYVTSIETLTENGETVGYVINFNSNDSVTIRNGQNGNTPQISARPDENGVYCWTIDGEWLLDKQGAGIPVTGNDGITPHFKIEDGYWFISYTDDDSWIKLGKATGDKGDTGQSGDSVFSSVTYDDEFVYLALADGATTLTIPMRSYKFDIIFTGGNELVCSSGETIYIPYTLINGGENADVAVIPHGGWEAAVERDGNMSGNITVTAPDPMKNGEVIVIASDGGEKTIMRKLVFEKGVVMIVTKDYLVSYNPSTLNVELSTNMGQSDYTVSIPDDAKSWISVSSTDTKAAMRDDIISLEIAANHEKSSRSAHISFLNSSDEVLDAITVTQRGEVIADNEIWYQSSDESIIEPNMKDATGTITSNTYYNGRGVIVFEDNLEKIWYGAFQDCNRLTNITIPAGVTEIDRMALYACSGLQTITLPDGLTHIGNNAFQDCSRLTGITLPESIESIGDAAFYRSGLTGITLPENLQIISRGTFGECSTLTDIVMPESIDSIGPYAFYCCTSLSNIEIPENVTDIGEYAFYDCTNLNSITLPEQITHLSELLFSKCDNLSNIEIPENVTSIGSNALSYTGITDITLPEGLISIGYGAFQASDLESITIPSTVTIIDDDAFMGCDNLTEITIPSSVENIGWRAFYACDGLISATISGKIISNEAFSRCSKLSELVIQEGVTEIGEYAFYECESLTDVTIPSSVKSVGEYAFRRCNNLSGLTIQEGVGEIGGWAFCECSSLMAVTIPSSVRNIGEYAFYDCHNIIRLTIGEGVTSIGSYAFNSCSSLFSITIPENVTSIGQSIFGLCDHLLSIYMMPSIPPALDYSLGIEASKTRITVPKDSYDLYRATDIWSKYSYAYFSE